MGLGRFVTPPFGNVSSFIFQVEKKMPKGMSDTINPMPALKMHIELTTVACNSLYMPSSF